jgi:hypothetical protein
MKSRRMQYAEPISYVEEIRNVYNIFAVIPEEKKPLM